MGAAETGTTQQHCLCSIGISLIICHWTHFAAGAQLNAACGPERKTALHAAAGAGTVDAIRALLKAGADVESRASRGHTPLSCAAVNNQAAAVAVLIGGGVLIDAPHGRHLAASLHDAAGAIRTLLAAGADPRARDKDGLEPLHWAAEKGQAAAVGVLIGAGAGCWSSDSWGLHPAMVCSCPWRGSGGEGTGCRR